MFTFCSQVDDVPLPPLPPAHVHAAAHCFLGLARSLRHAHLHYASVLSASSAAISRHAHALGFGPKAAALAGSHLT